LVTEYLILFIRSYSYTHLQIVLYIYFYIFTEAIDKFLLIADDNNDGLLHYPEFVKAITGGKEQLNVDRNILR